jgi:TolB-like protein/tetratricopeptide (TPR) repeat protein
VDFSKDVRTMTTGGQYQFGQYCLDADGHVLLRNGERVPLTPKALDLLVALVTAQGRPISKDELLETVWPDTVVEPGSLTSHVSQLRKALDGGTGESWIETLPRRGYRFTGTVDRAEPDKTARPSQVRLLVLPIENLSHGEDRYDYFSDGLTEELISQLAGISPDRIGVIARTSSMHYRDTNKTVAMIGKETGVSHVLEGSVRRADGVVRITAQLIRVSDESHIWAHSYERGLKDVLALQVEVVRAIAREVRVTLSPREEHNLNLDGAVSVEPRVHELYLKGRHFWYQRTEESIRRSIECFEQAIHGDAHYAPPYFGLSDAHTMLACRGVVPTAEAFHQAKAAARHGLQISPGQGEGYASLAHVRLHDWDWVGLDQDFAKALHSAPGYAISHYWYAEYLMAMGRTDEAVARVKLGHRSDPVNSVMNASVGMILYLAHRYDEALAVLRKGLELDPSHYVSHLRLGLVHQQMGSPQEAVAAMHRAVQLSGNSTEALAALAQSHAAAGDAAAAKDILRGLNEPQGRYVSPYNVARAYASLDDVDSTFQWLEQAYDEHNSDLIELSREPCFQHLHAHDTFRRLMRKVGWAS